MPIETRLTAKLALEAELARPVAQVLASYIAAWERSEGMVPLTVRRDMTAMLREAFTRHYARTLASMQGANLEAEYTIDSAAINFADGYAANLHMRAQERALYLINSMDRDLATLLAAQPVNVKASIVDELKDDKPFTVSFATRFQTSAMQAYYKLRSRLQSVVNAETQEPAESAMFEWVRRRRGIEPIVKLWITMEDEKVRDSHVDAGHRYGIAGPTPVDQPFELAGGRLMFPGDTSLGASLKEVINCRCALHYYVQTAHGLVPMGLSTPSIPARRTWRQGDRFGHEIPIRATEAVTLNGRTRARVVLGDDRTIATLAETTPSVINVRIDGQVVARAVHGEGQIRSLTIAPGRESLGIERLIRDSVAHSWARRPQ